LARIKDLQPSNSKIGHLAWDNRVRTLARRFAFNTVKPRPDEGETLKAFGDGVKKRVLQVATNDWQAQLDSKSSLSLYRQHKNEHKFESLIYDNSMGSKLLANARAGSLRTRLYRKKYTPDLDTTCQICHSETEDLGHILFRCTKSIRNPPVSNQLATCLGFIEDKSFVNQSKFRLQEWYLDTVDL